MHLLLRQTMSDDEEFLFDVYASTRAEEVAAWGWDPARRRAFLRMQFDARRRAYQAAYPDADDRVIVQGWQAVGRILVRRADDHIRLVDIAILPRYRKAGIGTCLIRELIAESRSSRRPLRLQVATDNRAAGLYERLGFSVTGGDAAYREMECRLEGPMETRAATLLDDLSASVFAAQLDTEFRVAFEGVPPVTLELFEVTEGASTSAQAHFSLVFRGPHDRVLSQGMCRMEHAALGAVVLFIVPIGPDSRGMRYQAVFNRLRTPEETSS
jgi:ribosomal protein S18 acetylase RimI-like enzyme